MLPWLVAHVGHPVSDRLRFGGRISKAIRELTRTDGASAKQLGQLRTQRLIVLLDHAAKHVPFYRESFSRSGIELPTANSSDERVRGTLATLPLLRKSDLHQRREDLLARDRPRATIVGRTSGSTGQPTTIVNSVESLARHRAAKQRARAWLGIGLGERWAMVWGRDAPDSWLYRTAIEFAENRRTYPVQDLETAAQANQTLAALQAFAPHLLYGYATGLMRICELQRSGQVQLPSVRAVISTAELLPESSRQELATTLQAKVGIEFGLSEAQFVAGTCQADSLHIAEENVIVEVLRSDGDLAAPGELGEIVITDLHDYASPLIRYATGDVGASLDTPCSCGRSHAQLELRLARTCELIELGGRQVHPEIFTLPHDFPYFARVERFRVQRVGDRQFAVDLLIRGEGSEAMILQAYERSVREGLGDDVELNVRRVESLPRSTSGKHRYYEDIRDTNEPG